MPQEYKMLSSAASRKIYALNITPQADAYWYLMTSFQILADNPRLLASTHKLLFPEVADRHNTSTAAVEGAIRRVIQQAWDDGLIKSRARPTPGQLLAMLLIEMAAES